MRLTNRKTNEVVDTGDMTNAQAAARFVELHGVDNDNWIWFWIHKSVAESNNDIDARDAIAFICDLFVLAIGMGLKRPQIRLHHLDQRFKLYLSARGTVCLKSGRITREVVLDGDERVSPVGNERYVGCFTGGKFLPASERLSYGGRNGNYGSNQNNRSLTDTEQDFLDLLKSDPVGFMAFVSRDMGRCCYCNLPLDDARSKAVGYGPVCAGRWGLPWGDEKHMEKAPSFSKVYDRTAAGICESIRLNPKDETNWLVLADWLSDHGLPRCHAPQNERVMPRAS